MKRKLFSAIWILPLCLCLGAVGFFSFTAQAVDPKETGSVSLAQDCYVQYIIGDQQSTEYLYAGSVGAGLVLTKKTKCSFLADQSCDGADARKLVKSYVDAGRACPNGFTLNFRTKVEGKIGTSGVCTKPAKPPCDCSQWSYK